jgi:predicted phage-related endonuclease
MALDIHKRANGVGGSELCAILGLSDYASAVDVWLLKTGRVAKFEGNEHTKRGHRLEPVIADYLQDELEELGESVLTCEQFAALNIPFESGAKIEDSDTIVHPEFSFMVGSPDRYIWGEGGNYKGAELKSTMLKIKNEVDVFEKAMSWVFQSQYYMMLTGLRKWYIAWIYLPGWEFYYIEIEYSEEMATLIMGEIKQFWEGNVLADIAPEPESISDVLNLYPYSDGEIEATEYLAEEIENYKGLKAQEKSITSAVAESKERIALAVLGYETIKYRGKIIATYKSQSSTRIDVDALRAYDKDLAAKFSKISNTRVLRLKKDKNE